jgi:zinc transporter, ZIP family
MAAPTVPARASRVPSWALALAPLALIVAALAALLAFGGDTLGERVGPPVEELAVEKTVLETGSIELTVRNTGPDPVTVAQVFVADSYVDFDATSTEIPRLGTETFTLDFPWSEGSPYLVTFVTETGVTIEHEIPVAVETPAPDGSFFGLMALLGLYVGVLPVLLGMLFLPYLRTAREGLVRFFLALTIGLLGFLAVDAFVEGQEIAAEGSGALGGVELLFVGAAFSYLALVGVDRWLKGRREGASSPFVLALLVAVGIGLHNLGEGLAIGTAYAVGELALGAFLVFGFALHNTTEGLAIVAPLAKNARASLPRLLALGLIAGAPAILGAVVGAAAPNADLAALLLGLGVGAIVQVIVQIAPSLRDAAGRVLHPASVAGILAGVAVMYATGLMVSA